MKLDMSKFLPWILAISVLVGAAISYANTKETALNNKERIQKCENKQESLFMLINKIDKKLERVLTILGD